MLSKKDIQKELGKGINIYPLHVGNIKENSINFTTSQNAWALKDGSVIRESKGQYKVPKVPTKDSIKITRGNSAIIEEKNSRYIVLLPQSTTIVETSEVIGVDNYIGGTLHSKVGIVAQGVGDISTMLGPCFAGHLMLALHNTTDEVISLRVGETFVSLVFFYLDTPSAINKNSNISGHVDKLSELGVKIDKTTREYLTADWKLTVEGIRSKLLKDKSYLEYKKEIKEKGRKELLKYFSMRNILLALLIAIILVVLGFVAYAVDDKNKNIIWSERYWTVFISGIAVPLFLKVGTLFKKKRK